MLSQSRKTYARYRSTKEGHIYNRYHAAKSRCKERGIAFDLDLDYLISIAPSHCPILGIELGWCQIDKGKQPNSPSIDRINPNLGYIKGNIAWLSMRANTIKNNGTAQEHRLIADWMDSITTI